MFRRGTSTESVVMRTKNAAISSGSMTCTEIRLAKYVAFPVGERAPHIDSTIPGLNTRGIVSMDAMDEVADGV